MKSTAMIFAVYSALHEKVQECCFPDNLKANNEPLFS